MNVTKNFIEKFNLFIGVLVLCATVFGVWYQTSDKTLELTWDLLSVDELTELSGTSNLKANFKYNGTDVKHLWKVSLRIKNSGDLVIIGKGAHSNLLEQSIPLTFGDNFKVIDLESTYNDLNLAAIRKKNAIELKFEQWRSDEIAVISVYLEAIGEKSEVPKPIVISRSLINGTIKINDLTSIKGGIEKEPKVIFPEKVLRSAKVIVNIFIILCFIITGMLVIMTPIEFIKRRLWENDNISGFHDHLDKMGNDFVDDKMVAHLINKYKDNPESAPESVWVDFKGERLKSDSVTNTLTSTLQVTLICALIITSATVMLLGT